MSFFHHGSVLSASLALLAPLSTCQYELAGALSDSMAVSVSLMLVYITKFFHWEAGYWNSMDIQHDRGELSGAEGISEWR